MWFISQMIAIQVKGRDRASAGKACQITPRPDWNDYAGEGNHKKLGIRKKLRVMGTCVSL